jgi:hypothetical protein
MPQFTVYQTQKVLFTDTTTGGIPPYTRSWSFPGGNITSGTGATAEVTYSTPGNYNVTLTVTDDNGLTNSLIRNDVMNIIPGFVTSTFTKSVDTALMSQLVTFTSTSTGQPSSPTSFDWKYAGQSASTSVWNFTGFLGDNDWQNIPGALINNPPGTQINFNVSLSTSFGPFTSTSSQLLPVRKIGAQENFYLNTTNGSSSPYQTNFNIGVYNDPPNLYTTNTFGYPGEFLIYKLTVNSFDQILNFHTNDEYCRIVCTGFEPTTDGVNSIDGYLMVTDDIYGTGDPQISNGQYILNPVLSNPVVDLYITGDQSITSLFDDYNWSLYLLNVIFSYPYPVTHTAQQYPLGIIFPSTELSKDGKNPVVPSQTYLESIGGEAYEVYIEVNYETSDPSNSTVVFGASGGNGNEKTSSGTSVDYYVVQDTTAGVGILTMLNTAISLDLPGGTGDIVFDSGTGYSVMPNANTTDYHGLIMKILNPDINSVIITDNSKSLSSVTGEVIPPFALDLQDLPENNVTCTGILSRIELSSYKASGYSQVNIGGRLF